MPITDHFSSQNRLSTRLATSQALSSRSSVAVVHPAKSRRLEKSKAIHDASTSPSHEATPPAGDEQSKEYPEERDRNAGAEFEIDWGNIWLSDSKEALPAARLGYRVKNKRTMRGNYKASKVWLHGADLILCEEQGKAIRLWLCRRCHERRYRGAAKVVNGYNHIVRHLQKEHKVNVNKELLPNSL